MQLSREFPQEHLIHLSGISPAFVGRITLYKQGQWINAEIDIVQSESGKIYSHVKSLYDYDEPRELLDLCVHYLKEYLDAKKH